MPDDPDMMRSHNLQNKKMSTPVPDLLAPPLICHSQCTGSSGRLEPSYACINTANRQCRSSLYLLSSPGAMQAYPPEQLRNRVDLDLPCPAVAPSPQKGCHVRVAVAPALQKCQNTSQCYCSQNGRNGSRHDARAKTPPTSSRAAHFTGCAEAWCGRGGAGLRC